ncbi:hypothetical protein VSDG_05257 [Cytospora chrysosperma]|uniref:Enoyl reductase (ER) domain-containing protein n=1 Tax=Cytospora chrysosperma TaxID=252740 RepID=A0A423VXA8_CYTCH|nr:hypothetical protein VSDG_05257 [Valsa sordida]
MTPPTPINQAAWLTAPGQYPVELKPSPYTTPGAKQIVVQNRAVAVNPMDWAKQAVGDMKWEWLAHPHILGEDIAGVVVELGSEVTRFQVGDRVIAHAVGFYLYGNRAAEGGFQNYTIVREHMASPIPDSLSFESACVVPMACSAAACALYQKGFLALDYPTVPYAAPNGQYLVVTGASTSVGSNAVQLAHASGYQVVTTCSTRHFEHAKRLGASHVFDYASATVETDMAAALQGKKVAGAFAIGPGSVELCLGVLGQLAESESESGARVRKLVVKASFPWPPPDTKASEYPAYMKWVDTWNEGIDRKAKEIGGETKFVEGAELGLNEVSTKLYVDFLPDALGGGHYRAAPEPLVVGKGLEFIQEAMDLQRKGVSAKKVVVLL